MLEGQHQILIVLWAIFAVAILLYLWISATFLVSRQLGVGGFFAGAARTFFWLLTFADLATLVWWKRRFLTREALLGGARSYKLLQALQAHEGPLEERAAGVLSSYVTGKIVAFTLVEAVAIYGFAQALVSRYFVGQYILSAAAGFLLLLEFPSRKFLRELIGEVEKEFQK